MSAFVVYLFIFLFKTDVMGLRTPPHGGWRGNTYVYRGGCSYHVCGLSLAANKNQANGGMPSASFTRVPENRVLIAPLIEERLVQIGEPVVLSVLEQSLLHTAHHHHRSS